MRFTVQYLHHALQLTHALHTSHQYQSKLALCQWSELGLLERCDAFTMLSIKVLST